MVASRDRDNPIVTFVRKIVSSMIVELVVGIGAHPDPVHKLVNPQFPLQGQGLGCHFPDVIMLDSQKLHQVQLHQGFQFAV